MRRIELRADQTHLVLDCEQLFPGEHPELALAAIRKRLRDDEQAVAERGGAAGIRIVLPQQLQLRGGRTSIAGGSSEQRRGQISPGLVNTLKRARADLVALNASPFTRPEQFAFAMAPATQHDRQVCRLAFLAPDLQRLILAGKQPARLGLRQILKTPMPLAWAYQPAWLEAISKA